MPFKACVTAANMNSAINTMNNMRAISTAPAAMPLKPRTPAIRAITKNMIAYLSMESLAAIRLYRLERNGADMPQSLAANKVMLVR